MMSFVTLTMEDGVQLVDTACYVVIGLFYIVVIRFLQEGWCWIGKAPRLQCWVGRIMWSTIYISFLAFLAAIIFWREYLLTVVIILVATGIGRYLTRDCA